MSVKVTDNSRLAYDAMLRGARKGMIAATLLVESDAKIFAPKKTGYHARSISSEVIEDNGVIQGIVGHGSDYGGYLEEGTRFMDPRPHFRPALDKNQEAGQRLIVEGIRAELQATLPKGGA